MISPVNRYEQLVCARLFDFFSSKSHWNRSLWNIGTMLALQEVLEASKAQQQGHLSETTIRGAIATATRLLQHDPGLGTTQERETLVGLLKVNGTPRNELPYEGLEYEAIAEATTRRLPKYLEEWANAVASREPPLPERTARAIAAHLLDSGFHSDFLHRWWTRQIRSGPERPLSEILSEAAGLVLQPELPFVVLVAFPSPLTPPRGLLPPQNWLNATQVSEWFSANGFESEGIRQQGGLLLSVHAREAESAVQAAAERIEMFYARVLLSLRKEIEPLPFAWVSGARKRYSLERRLRGIKIGAMRRENRIWLESDADIYIDPAIELLAPLQIGSSSAAIAGGWAAIESLLGEPRNKRADPAERLANIVACSFPRAELTDLAFSIIDLGGVWADRLQQATTNKERSELVAKAILARHLPEPAAWSERAAVERMTDLLAAPQLKLTDIRDHMQDTFARLYRQRNLVLHAGLTKAIALRATLRTAAPLVGAGLDRISHARFVGNMRPVQVAARARTSLENLSSDEPMRCVDLLGI
jgi:hypothetical protein